MSEDSISYCRLTDGARLHKREQNGQTLVTIQVGRDRVEVPMNEAPPCFQAHQDSDRSSVYLRANHPELFGP
jgi:hypothetical protein